MQAVRHAGGVVEAGVDGGAGAGVEGVPGIDAEVVDRELSGRGQLTAKAKRAG